MQNWKPCYKITSVTTNIENFIPKAESLNTLSYNLILAWNIEGFFLEMHNYM